MARTIKNKIINYLINNGKKNTIEKLLKNSFKKLSQQSKKQFKTITYLALNYSLAVFKLEKKKVKTARIEKIKFQPFFVFSNKIRIFYGIKFITNSLKKRTNFKNNFKNELLLLFQKNNELILKKNENQEKVFMAQNILTFYRWYF